MTVLIDLLFASLVLVLGGVAGWWLRGRDRPQQPGQQEPGPPPDQEQEFAREALARLAELAAGVAEDVGRHSSQVREINDELNAQGDSETQSVATLVTRLVHANAGMQQQLASAERKLQEQAQQIETHAADARTDPLTGLANRRAFDDELARGEAAFRRHGRPLCVVLLDVDHFKAFNDTHGHQAGDLVLQQVAQVLQQTIGQAGLVARYGGEEFAVVFSGQAIREIRDLAVQAIGAVAAARVQFEGQVLQVTASGGLAQWTADEQVETTIRRADEALYASKEAGRNCVHWHDGRQVRAIGPSPAPAAPQPPTPPSAQQAEPRQVPETEEQLLEIAQRQTEALQRDVQSVSNRRASSTAPAVDRLTGLATLPVFRQQLEDRLQAGTRQASPLAALLIRVDGHPQLAQQYGTQTAQMVLRVATQFLTAAVRPVDQTARYGQDSLAALLPAVHLDHATALAERLRRAIARCRVPRQGEPLHFTVSIAVAEAVSGEDPARLLQRLEGALQAAVEYGGNRTYLHNGRHCAPVHPTHQPCG